MVYKIIQPATHLQPFIKDYTLFHFKYDTRDAAPVKPFPANTEQCIVFYLRGSVTAIESKTGTSSTFAKIAVNGSLVSRYDFKISPHCLLVSVHFQPGTLSKFLKLPLPEFTDKRVDAEAILNPEIHCVYERMSNAPSYESILQLLEDYLWQRIKSLKISFQPLDRIAQIVSENPSIYSIEAMASNACLSISQFERRFTQQLGIGPKLYGRINRFYQAYKLKDQKPQMDWLRIALETGYYDYQHLVKDFKQFSNATPTSLLLAQAKAPEKLFPII
jgi:AraC-like DNA-binding protein